MKIKTKVFLCLTILSLVNLSCTKMNSYKITIKVPSSVDSFFVEITSNVDKLDGLILTPGKSKKKRILTDEEGVQLSASGGDFSLKSVKFSPESGGEYLWDVTKSHIEVLAEPSDDDDSEDEDCDPDGYDGPEFDVQVDSQCKLAYGYECAGDYEARDVACELYYQWKDSWTGSDPFPSCPYCN